ncbi:transglycosylase domain-containing protein [Cyanobacterium stanieri LEGE 03274]|uniref:Transglycosylase domain-containing protein n=1 Tax=Cyanobacterium stanieri LEGE 03274 TaxID=1828756 RepID=A0ABR9V4K9_9CHRO|nr:transglycosylase domain-containing protein [Cyanobacterium stanieri]MBE9222772.1 transglycosylase domain-containing protein [Cyanobacterium stanieri LEGE 03274]
MGKKSSSPATIDKMVTGVLQTIQAQFNLPKLKQGAIVPKIILKNGSSGKTHEYPLLGERYIIGRNKNSCDIILRNPIISQIHCAVEKDKKTNRFKIKDLQSTNGIYLGKKRYQSIALHHNDTVTLGPPELEDVIELYFDKPPSKLSLILRYGLFTMAGFLILISAVVAVAWSRYTVYPMPQGNTGATVVYGEDGVTPLAPRISSPHRELERLSDFSPYLPQALIASEDSRYYWHFGVDPVGVLRAILINTGDSGVRQGASTITQQLARSLYPEVGRENTIARKVREMIVATKLEAVYSKDEIMKGYLNRVYLGINLYGFEDAARFYFGKSARDVSIEEAAALVAILPAPNAYNPVQDYDTALGLRNRVISRMLSLSMITEDQANSARRSRIEITPEARETLSNTIAPYFYSYVFDEVRMLLGADLLQEGDFIIETGLNLEYQREAENSLKDYINTNGSRFNFDQGAIATINSQTGEIVALVGGKDFQESQFNRATQAQRQAASTFKLFSYAAALEAGISPHKTYSCAALQWQGVQFRPCNNFSAPIDMFVGMATSENAVALRIAQDVGLNKVVAIAKKMGINSPLNPVPGLALGQSEVNVLEMTGAYATIANQGVWNRPHAINVIRDGRDCENVDEYNTCREVYRFNQGGYESKQAITPQIAQTMHQMFQRVVTSGTGRNANIGRGEGGKTGTNSQGIDLWFIGYSPQDNLTTGVWLGNDDNSPTRGGSAQAASLWGSYMRKLL